MFDFEKKHHIVNYIILTTIIIMKHNKTINYLHILFISKLNIYKKNVIS